MEALIYIVLAIAGLIVVTCLIIVGILLIRNLPGPEIVRIKDVVRDMLNDNKQMCDRMTAIEDENNKIQLKMEDAIDFSNIEIGVLKQFRDKIVEDLGTMKYNFAQFEKAYYMQVMAFRIILEQFKMMGIDIHECDSKSYEDGVKWRLNKYIKDNTLDEKDYDLMLDIVMLKGSHTIPNPSELNGKRDEKTA